VAVPSDPVLLDNCAISACVAAGAWEALAARYTLETVEEVESEAATGYHHRQNIPPAQFRQQVKVHPVSEEARFEAQAAHADLTRLDEGELDLWVHALGRKGGWILCGPDIASITFGVRLGYADRLISLEALLSAIGYKPKQRLQENQTAKWLSDLISKIRLEMQFEKLK
jgi:hypothetical protein